MYSTKLLLITICLEQISFTCTWQKARKRHDMFNRIPRWKIRISFAIVDPFLTRRLIHLSLSWTFAAGRWHFLFLSARSCDRKLKAASRECKWVSEWVSRRKRVLSPSWHTDEWRRPSAGSLTDNILLLFSSEWALAVHGCLVHRRPWARDRPALQSHCLRRVVYG